MIRTKNIPACLITKVLLFPCSKPNNSIALPVTRDAHSGGVDLSLDLRKRRRRGVWQEKRSMGNSRCNKVGSLC